MTTPYREAAPQGFCAICEAATVLACRRCDRPGCAEHLFGDPALCTECDLEINSRNLSERVSTTHVIGGVAGYAAFLGACVLIGGPVGVALFGVLTLGGMTTAVVADVVQRKRRRTERLRYAEERRALPAGERRALPAGEP